MGLLDMFRGDDALEDPIIVTEAEMADEEQLEPPLDPSMVEAEEDEPAEDIGVPEDEQDVVTENKDGTVTAQILPSAATPMAAVPKGATRTVRPRYGVTGTLGPAPRFTWREVACNNGTRLPARYKKFAVRLARALNNMRVTIARQYGVHPSRVFITVNSWYRTPAYNASIGGVGNSTHTVGQAADITVYIKGRRGRVRRVPPSVVARHAERRPSFQKGGIGRYANFTHLDVRGYRSRWSG